MKKDVLRILVSLALLVGLVGFVAWHRKQKAAKDDKAEEEKKIAQIDMEAIGRIVVDAKEGGKIVFVRRTKDAQGKFSDEWAALSNEFDSVSDWAIVEPIKSLPDYWSVNTLINNIKDLTSTKVISEKGENRATYNLENAPLGIDLYEKNVENPKLTVRVGDQNSAKSGPYLQTSASPQIVLGSNTLDYLKTRKPSDWRKKEIIGFKDLSKVKRVEITYDDKGKKNSVAASRGEAGWTLTKPEGLPADGRAIENFLSDVKSLHANTIPSDDAAKDAKSYGLDKPYAKIDIAAAEESGEKHWTVLIGRKFEKNKDIYVRRMDFPQVYAVREGMKGTLTKQVKDWVRKKPFSADKGIITDVLLVNRGKTTELGKKGNTWTLVKPVEDRVNSDQVAALLTKIVEFQAGEFLGTKAPAGFGKPQVSIQVTVGGKKRDLSFFDPGSVKDLQGKSSSPDLYYRFSRAAYDGLVTAFQGAREKKILPLKMEELASVQIQKNPVKVSFIRNAEGQWVLGTVDGAEPPLKAKLREKSTSDSVVNGVENLEIETFMEGGAGSPEASEMTVEFRPKTGEAISWSFGKKDGNIVTVRSAQRNVVGQMSASKAEFLEQLFKIETPQKGS
ncbi:MAG TPA: DUF4340 domain-containing protein [Bdellovibrionota bacterium]|nr:DUF4340 domain-containing protein [Bdellovibrionota bacterium]